MKKGIRKDDPTRKKAVEIGELEGYEYWIAHCPVSKGFNGYVVFPRRPVREETYYGILTYVPVHGGITYAREYKDGIVYGFDTAHDDSDSFPITDKGWIREQIKLMIAGIQKARQVEAKYLKALTNKTRAKYAQQVIDTGGNSTYRNFGILMNLLSGGRL